MKLYRTFRHCSAVAAALVFALILGVAANAQDNAPVGITINGAPVNVSPPPIMQAGRVFVPLRGVFEQLGASVVYSNGQINATGNGREISLTIGSTQATVNGSPVTIDVAPFIVGESTYVPLRFVSQALGASVNWDESSHTVEITMNGAGGGYQPPPDNQYDESYDANADYVSEAPPPLPYYDPPPAPAPNWIWTPGYWAWGPAGYYWVPGTWVPAPQPDYLWTPGYWAYQNNYYGWNPGYWAPTVGFYGGVNYGGGYFGHGFVGGRWHDRTFEYNAAVLPVNRTVIKNVYVDKTVIVNNYAGPRPSYNGPRGVTARPSPSELAAARVKHVPPTPQQREHVQVAAQDRLLYAQVNHGKPPVVAAPRPFTPAQKPPNFVPVTAQDKVAAQKLVVHPAAHPAPAAPRQAPAMRAAPAPPAVHPVVRPGTTATTPAHPTLAHPAPARPAEVHTAPARPAAVRTAPGIPERPATVPVHTAPAMPVRPAPAPVRPAVVHTPAAMPALPSAPVPVRPAVVHTPAAMPARPAVVRTAPPRPAAAQPAPARPAVARPVPAATPAREGEPAKPVHTEPPR